MKDRITVLDSLRGFSLAGIAVVHFMQQYYAAMPPAAHASYAQHSTVDRVVEALGFLLFTGKGFALFSFMFGLSFALQMQRAEERDPGRDFRPRFVWRLAILLAIGTLHSLAYAGDILGIYALLGLPLVLFYRVGDRWLFIIALVLMLGGPRVMTRLSEGQPSPEVQKAREARDQDEAAVYFQAAKSGPVRKLVLLNATYGLRSRMDFQFGIMGRGYQTFAYFLLGLWAGRRRVFEDLAAHRPLFRGLWRWGGLVTLGLPLLLTALTLLARSRGAGADGASGPPGFYSWRMVFGLCLYDLWNFAVTLFYLGAFAQLYQRERWHRLLRHLAPVGRMALTNYLLQSVVGTLVFLSFGLGLLGEAGHSLTVPLAGVVFMAEIGLSRLWLRRFHYGPLEWLWRSLTFLRAQPFRKAPSLLSSSVAA